ncbi:cation:proton antiporter [Natrialba swarupiae]|nr:cation:proton antiporter [Natrialba swarupiae]
MSRSDTHGDTYTESQVIMTTVKIIAPFTLTYGAFLSLHGADTPGGSFQGCDHRRHRPHARVRVRHRTDPAVAQNSVVVGLVTGGVAIFIATGLATIALGKLPRVRRVRRDVRHRPLLGMEAIEVGGVALIVAGVVITLFRDGGGLYAHPSRGGHRGGEPG